MIPRLNHLKTTLLRTPLLQHTPINDLLEDFGLLLLLLKSLWNPVLKLHKLFIRLFEALDFKVSYIQNRCIYPSIISERNYVTLSEWLCFVSHKYIQTITYLTTLSHQPTPGDRSRDTQPGCQYVLNNVQARLDNHTRLQDFSGGWGHPRLN